MSKGGFASEKVMRNYLSALLVDEDEKEQALAESEKPELRPVAKLLEKVNVLEQSPPTVARQKAEPVVQTPPAPQIKAPQALPTVESMQKAISEAAVSEKQYRKGEFQALFFDVAGLTVAVPLTELGGIHNMGKLNILPGKPDWFMGVMLHREEKINVVNSALWVMPEKYDEDMENQLDYQYIIMLDESRWGLTCESLINTVTLSQDDVKWREHKGRRPWLAGLIKERMCALLDVGALIELLEQGQGSADDLQAPQ